MYSSHNPYGQETVETVASLSLSLPSPPPLFPWPSPRSPALGPAANTAQGMYGGANMYGGHAGVNPSAMSGAPSAQGHMMDGSGAALALKPSSRWMGLCLACVRRAARTTRADCRGPVSLPSPMLPPCPWELRLRYVISSASHPPPTPLPLPPQSSTPTRPPRRRGHVWRRRRHDGLGLPGEPAHAYKLARETRRV